MVTDYILKSLDENHEAQLLLLDLTSDFDTILHKNLFVRLAEISIFNNALAFIKIICKTDIIRLSLMNVNLKWRV